MSSCLAMTDLAAAYVRLCEAASSARVVEELEAICETLGSVEQDGERTERRV